MFQLCLVVSPTLVYLSTCLHVLKVLLLTYKAIKGQMPSYLKWLLLPNTTLDPRMQGFFGPRPTLQCHDIFELLL